MASGQQTIPSFDGQSFTNYDNSCTMYLEVSGIAAEIQNVHFDGYDGDTMIHHGYHNRQWVAQGRIFQTSSLDIIQYIGDLESYLDDAFDDETWRSLVDSFGNSWSRARITQVIGSNMKAYMGGWVCDLVVIGVLDGSPVMSGPGVG